MSRRRQKIDAPKTSVSHSNPFHFDRVLLEEFSSPLTRKGRVAMFHRPLGSTFLPVTPGGPRGPDPTTIGARHDPAPVEAAEAAAGPPLGPLSRACFSDFQLSQMIHALGRLQTDVRDGLAFQSRDPHDGIFERDYKNPLYCASALVHELRTELSNIFWKGGARPDALEPQVRSIYEPIMQLIGQRHRHLESMPEEERHRGDPFDRAGHADMSRSLVELEVLLHRIVEMAAPRAESPPVHPADVQEMVRLADYLRQMAHYAADLIDFARPAYGSEADLLTTDFKSLAASLKDQIDLWRTQGAFQADFAASQPYVEKIFTDLAAAGARLIALMENQRDGALARADQAAIDHADQQIRSFKLMQEDCALASTQFVRMFQPALSAMAALA